MTYELTGRLPSEEKFGLMSQARRSAVSVPSNIAEGYRRRSGKDYARYLSIADGSAAELETQMILIEQIHDLDTKDILSLLDEVMRMLSSMIKKLT